MSGEPSPALRVTSGCRAIVRSKDKQQIGPPTSNVIFNCPEQHRDVEFGDDDCKIDLSQGRNFTFPAARPRGRSITSLRHKYASSLTICLRPYRSDLWTHPPPASPGLSR